MLKPVQRTAPVPNGRILFFLWPVFPPLESHKQAKHRSDVERLACQPYYTVLQKSNTTQLKIQTSIIS